MSTASVYAPILKKERQSDGTLLVTGIATDDTLDVDDQICDPAWLERAMPAWFQYGNIREQHSSIAAGVAMKLEQDGSRHIVTALVVDPTSVMKIESGVLKGFSIGIRDPRIAKDKSAPGGRIVDGEIVEVSLVDRPANPSCMLELAKSSNGIVRQVETLIEKEDGVMERCKECGKGFQSGDLDDGKMCKECAGKAAEATEASVGDETTAEEEGTAMAAEESSQPVGEESSQPVGEASEVTEGKEEDPEHMAEEMDRLDAIAETLAQIIAMLQDSGKRKADSEVSEASKSIKTIDERLSKLEKSASRGPVRTVVKAAPVAATVSKAAEYRAKAAATSDPALASGYLLLASEADNAKD
jgi:hypothetical protein